MKAMNNQNQPKKTQTLCNSQYRDLCARLGELYIQKQAIDTEIAAIISQISIINSIVPSLIKLEDELSSKSEPICQK